MISKTDKKILLELQKNGRASYAELAAKLGISVATVASRAEKLIEDKIIEIRAVPNPFKIGLRANAFIAVQAEPMKIDTICSQLVDHYNISMVMTVYGRYDIVIFVYFPTWDIMHDFINEKLSKIDGVQKIETFYLKKFVKRYEGLFKDYSSDLKPVKLKDVECKLLVELTKDGRMNMSDISGKIGIHVSTVSRRIHALIEDDIFKVTAIPNPLSFGYCSSAFIILDAEATNVERICSDLFPYPEVVSITTLINGSGIILGLQDLNNQVLYKFIKEKITQIRGIQRIETVVIAELKKRYYGWFLSDDIEG